VEMTGPLNPPILAGLIYFEQRKIETLISRAALKVLKPSGVNAPEMKLTERATPLDKKVMAVPSRLSQNQISCWY
jgi:hypothetical protein